MALCLPRLFTHLHLLHPRGLPLPCPPTPLAGPVYQFDRYYKDGQFYSCSRQYTELTQCLKLKAAGPEESKAILKQLVKKDTSPTEGKVWEARPKQEL